MPSVNGVLAFTSTKPIPPQLINRSMQSIAHRAPLGFIKQADHVVERIEPSCGIKEGANTLALGCQALFSDEDRGEALLHGSTYFPESFAMTSEVCSEPEVLAEALGEVDGSYSFVFADKGSLVCGRDVLGCKPLFVSKVRDFVAITSEKRQLFDLGFKEAAHLPPGFVYRFTPDGSERHRIPWSFDDRVLNVGLDEASDGVLDLLETSVKRRVMGRTVCVASSGGLDSSLLTFLARRYSKTTLVAVGVEGSGDLDRAEELAETLRVEVFPLTVAKSRLLHHLQSTEKILQSKGALDLSIGLALGLVSMHAAKNGMKRMILGQLADEQFGGYARYSRILAEDGDLPALLAMRRDTLNAYVNDFLRDELVSSPYVGTCLPYAQQDLVKYSLQLPVSVKIDLNRGVRKLVLREAAVKAGLPEELAYRSKKAFQYSSGIQKMVRRVMREERSVAG